jgi:two-component system phosphate regulon response regulator PhoB
MRILLIEDDTTLGAAVRDQIAADGQSVDWVTRLDAAGDALRGASYDLILLDLMLPDTSGTEACRELRADERTRDVPIIMLTAKGEEVDRVVGFEVGADDYVVKPFSVRELVLRVRAVLKRSERSSEERRSMTFGRLRVDVDAHRVWVDGGEVTLTALELKLLTTLLSRRGRVQSRDRLLSDVWGIDADVTTRTVDTHIKRLRTKLGAAADYVETLRGVGYRFRERPDGEGA